MTTEAEVINQRSGAEPVTAGSLLRDLRRLADVDGEVVICHTSLSSLGWVCGGPQTVVDALLAWVGAAGTLVMPTQSGQLSDPATWRHPPVPEHWWDTIRATMPAYDPRTTPTRWMGAVVECFRTHPASRRSGHPIDSFAANGPLAAAIVDDHPLDYGVGEGSPLSRLHERDAFILLLGVGHDRNTTLHLAEHRATFPGKRVVREGAPVLVDGRRQWVTFAALDWNDDDFPALGTAYTIDGRPERVGQVGRASARLLRVRDLVDFGVGWLASTVDVEVDLPASEVDHRRDAGGRTVGLPHAGRRSRCGRCGRAPCPSDL